MLVDGADVRERRRRQPARARSPSSPTTASSSPPASPRTSPTPGPSASREEVEDGGPARPGRRLHPRPAGRLRDEGRRARPDPLRRPAPAGRDRPRPARRPAHPDPRRRHLLGRRDHRGGDQGRPARGDGGPHHLRHRPPALDRLARRRGDRHGRRQDRRPRHPRGAARGLQLLPRDRRARARRLASSCSATSSSARRWRSCERGAQPPEASLPALRRGLAPAPRPGPARPQGALDDRPAAPLPRPRWR